MSQTIIMRATKVLSDIPSLHRTIVQWASEVVAKSTSFVNNFVLGTFHPEGPHPRPLSCVAPRSLQVTP